MIMKEVLSIVDTIASSLGLAPHDVLEQSSGKVMNMSLPADIEMHQVAHLFIFSSWSNAFRFFFLAIFIFIFSLLPRKRREIASTTLSTLLDCSLLKLQILCIREMYSTSFSDQNSSQLTLVRWMSSLHVF